METKFNYGDKVLVPMNVDSVVIDDGGVTYRVSRSGISGASVFIGGFFIFAADELFRYGRT